MNFETFSNVLYESTSEILPQKLTAFNEASNYGLRLTTDGIGGDAIKSAMFAAIYDSQRRKTGTNNVVTPTELKHQIESAPQVEGGFGPIHYLKSELDWIRLNEASAIQAISSQMADAILRDQVNTGILAATAAIGNQADTLTTYTAGAGSPTYLNINESHAKFGDMSDSIVVDIMDGTTYHQLLANNLQNASNLFVSAGVLVVNILGKVVVKIDNPTLMADGGILSLVTGGAVVQSGTLDTNMVRTNGRENIESTLQADYNFKVGVKGCEFDKNIVRPSNAQLGTGTNWNRTVTHAKAGAGVYLKRA